ncbi:FeoA family protein [[Clostridium] polysaccharolyticum]|uniref:Ferrous iron transport protein A n=1 Tax=[Clostridium] polysaccharolyticum TaxID=29364 RepID=A0A1I0D0Z1_9FIRM|nr:FeoA family protein [[Clostridium] polysaccharolyticum]SET25600.1 ferrous iron transport protein A [[Clostridium] polysaccharolyticum]
MQLAECRKDTSYIVQKMSLGLETNRRLQALGVTKGTKITVLNRKKSGSVIFFVRGSRLAIGKEIAQALEVKESE